MCRNLLFPGFLLLSLAMLTTCSRDSPKRPEPQVPSRITISPASATLTALSDTLRLTAAVLDAGGQSITGAVVDWASSDQAVATVSNDGLVTAAGNGSTRITARSGEVFASVEITVSQIPGSITLEPDQATLTALGATLQLNATVLDGSDQPIPGAPVEWDSSNEAVATVSEHGLVTATGNGSARITARSGDAAASTNITVAQAAGRITLEPDQATLTALGATLQLNATVLDGSGQPISGAAVEWASSDESVATVSNEGLVTATGNGNARVTARSGDVTASVEVTVVQAAGRITLTPDQANLTALGETVRLQAAVIDAGGQTVAGAVVEWASSNESVAIVGNDGLVTAAGNGSTRITARSGEVFASVEITVSQIPGSIALAPEKATLTALGATLQLNATVLDGSDQPIDGAPVDWASSDESVATVNDHGLVTAAGNGSARISARSGDAAASTNITVAQAAGRITLEPEKATFTALGETLQLSATVLDGSDQPIPGAPVEWDSSDQAVATVSEHGLVTATGNGSAHISAASGESSAHATVTVAIAVASPDREVLVRLYNETNGTGWTNNENWMSDQPLDRWQGITTNSAGNVEQLQLSTSGVSGEIPAALGDLADLKGLFLSINGLSGEIPSSLGRLSRLEYLDLSSNDLSGEIPSSLGDLTRLKYLNLSNNNLSGEIPASLGNLSGLEHLDLSRNGLSGGIPREWGNLVSLLELNLFENTALSGPLPGGLSRSSIQFLQLHLTQVCAPRNAGFQAWLQGIPEKSPRTIPACVPTMGAAAYLTQATQSLASPVPLLAGEDALLRVFVTAPEDVDVDLPPMRASFYLDGALAHTADIPGQATRIPPAIDEGSLSTSANVTVPGAVVAPGLEMVVEIDPDGTLPASAGIGGRIPESGRTRVEVLTVPPLNLTLVPLLWTENPDRSLLEEIEGLSASDEHFWLTRDLLPVGDFNLAVREPVMTSLDPVMENSLQLMHEMALLRTTDGATGHYMGILKGGGGRSLAPGFASVSMIEAGTMAHELGHNMSLEHAPCGSPLYPDPDYPNDQGIIGAWGYDFRDGTLVRPETYDMMSYCDPRWISPFNFTKALRYRHFREMQSAAGSSFATRTLVLWGGIDESGGLVIEPGFAMDAPVSLPRRGGPYRLRGEGSNGRTLFNLTFSMDKIGEDEGDSFAFAVPARPEWATNLRRVLLSGPEGAVAMERDGPRSAALLLHRSSGRVRGILQDWEVREPAPPSSFDAGSRLQRPQRPGAGTTFRTAGQLDSPYPGLEIITSRGIPDAEAWSR